jgi:hypothetical protein
LVLGGCDDVGRLLHLGDPGFQGPVVERYDVGGLTEGRCRALERAGAEDVGRVRKHRGGPGAGAGRGAGHNVDDLAELRDGVGVERSRLLQLVGYLLKPFHWRGKGAEQQLGERVLVNGAERGQGRTASALVGSLPPVSSSTG